MFLNIQRVQWKKGKEVKTTPPFSVEEMKTAMLRLKIKKVPSPDYLTSEIVKVTSEKEGKYFLKIVKVTSEKEGKYFLDIAKEIIQMGTFLSKWEVTKLVLIEKPKKTEKDVVNYWSICLINTLGKVLESLVELRTRRVGRGCSRCRLWTRL